MELYLVAYTHEVDALSHKRELTSTSFGESFKTFKKVGDITYAIEQQNKQRAVQLIAVTPLHSMINYIGERDTPPPVETTHNGL